MQLLARSSASRLSFSQREYTTARFLSTARRSRRVEPRAQDLSARFQQLERTLRTKEALEDQLADTHHVRSSPHLNSSQDIQPRRTVKPTRTFHGLIIPDKPSEPEADGMPCCIVTMEVLVLIKHAECCMSGCAVCVYDLYDESIQSYKESLAAIHASLAKMDIPESDWPVDIRTAPASPDLKRERSVTLSAFEEMERRLAERRTQQAINAG